MSLIKNTGWNILGLIIPSLVAIPSLGFLARNLDVELFGIYTLAIAIVGYASIFDMGLTRAVVREVAIFKADELEKKKIIESATIVVLSLGVVACVIIYLFSVNIESMLNISRHYKEETITSIKILSISIPLFLLNQVWLSILEGEEKFKVLSYQKTITSSMISALPAIFVYIYGGLVSAIIGLLVARLVSIIIAFFLVKKKLKPYSIKYSKETVTRLIKFGGWITVSNIISPVMTYFDRFLLSSILGANNVAFYTAPSTALSRLSIIPSAVGRAIFPKFSFSNDQERYKLRVLGYTLILLICGGVSALGIIFAEDILVLWMGSSYSGSPVMVFRVLLIGFIFNSLAQIPFSEIQGRGKAKYTALIHVIEIVPYLLLLNFLIVNYGVVGAAVAWACRVFFDFLLLVIGLRMVELKCKKSEIRL